MREALKNMVRYWRLYLLTLVLGIGGSFQLGMQVSIMASPAEHIQSFVNQTWLGRYKVPVDDSTNMLIWSFIVSVFSLGGWVGAIHSGSLPVTHGRKKALLFNNIVALVAAVLMFVTLLFFPEAPRYLYIDKGDTEGCKKALQWLWQEDDLQMEMDEMGKERASMQGQKVKTIWDVLTSRCVRWQLLVLSLFIDRVGRKILMGYGYLLMGVIMSILIVMLSIKDLYSWVPYVNIALIFSVICVYGLGPYIFLQAWRPSAYVISGSINWFSLFLIGMFFPFIDGLGQFCFLIFVAYCIFSAAFMLYFIPETKGKSMLEIMEDFNKLNYKNKGTDTEKADFVMATKF
ncbi:unnamed protein product [Coregonus sp. 'balchen']|nr:unnamed protein product [Coregonus sp. 'balchen']